jgi:hypothetical protein
LQDSHARADSRLPGRGEISIDRDSNDNANDRFRSGSQFGHVAIIVDGIAYSRAHDGYDSKKTYAQYVAVQESFRDSVGYVLRVSPEEKKKIEAELKRRVAVTNGDPARHGYSLLDNSCSSNVADVLNLVGIVAHDPRWSVLGMVSPEDIAAGLSHSKRVKEKRFYPKER